VAGKSTPPILMKFEAHVTNDCVKMFSETVCTDVFAVLVQVTVDRAVAFTGPVQAAPNVKDFPDSIENPKADEVVSTFTLAPKGCEIDEDKIGVPKVQNLKPDKGDDSLEKLSITVRHGLYVIFGTHESDEMERNESVSTAEELLEANMCEDSLLIKMAVLCSFFREQLELKLVLSSKFWEVSFIFFSVLLTEELSCDFKKEKFSVLLILQLL